MAEKTPLREAHFGFPGAVRDRLVAAILDGRKTATSSLLAEYQVAPGHPLPAPGDRSAVLDSAGRAVAVIEVTEVTVARFGDVDAAFAAAEGEGFQTVADWRAAHRGFWQSEQMRAAMHQAALVVDDQTLVVTERFRLVQLLAGNADNEHANAKDDEGGHAMSTLVDESDVYERVRAAWSDVLGISGFGREDDFFRIGGQSLRAVQVMRSLSRSLGVRLPVKLLHNNRTPQRLTAAVVACIQDRENP